MVFSVESIWLKIIFLFSFLVDLAESDKTKPRSRI